MSRIQRILLFSLSILVAMPGGAFAQTSSRYGAALRGVVRDATGAVVVDAKVTVYNDSNGVRRELQSNSAGVFAAPALAPTAGHAKFTVEKAGFRKYESSQEITIEVGQNTQPHHFARRRLRRDHQVGEVSASTPLVEDTKTDVSSRW